MSATHIVDGDALIEQLIAVRRIVDTMLRALGEDRTPPLSPPPSRSAESFLGAPVAKGHEHQFVSGFGSMVKTCSICGAKG